MRARTLASLVVIASMVLFGACAKRGGHVDTDKGTVGSDTAGEDGTEGATRATPKSGSAASAAASETATSPTESPAEQGGGPIVKLSYFGEQTIADGAVALMDGGTHGVQGHTVVVAADGSATWERRLEGMRPRGKAGGGRFQLAASELERIRDSRSELWKLAAPGSESFYPPIQHGPPRWVWAIVMRQGDETRALEGGAVAPSEGKESPKARALLEWLRERVDALAAGRR